MAAKYEEPVQGYPLAPAAVAPRSDQEYGPDYRSQERFQKKNRTKRLAYIAAFSVILTAVIVAMAIVVVRVRTPRIRLTDVAVTNSVFGGGNNVELTAHLWIRNMNFGRYEMDGGLAMVSSGAREVIGLMIRDRRVRGRSTRRFPVGTSYFNLVRMAGNGARVFDLSVSARLRGEVRLLGVIRRQRWADLNCTMTVDFSTNDVRNLRCD